ncbi:MAG: transcription factor S [Candidatus Methanomethylophilaceae archaeon]|nr:transcription factor S [Candidatus Methanomethylophilaceae archaeon]MDD4244871.1 transcription factor S [Candidatus Methanomethylophilaceae archaeon]
MGVLEAENLFCSCGSLMFPKNGEYVCSKCQKRADLGPSETFTTDMKAKETTVITENIATLPKTHIICPECANTEAYFSLRQTRSADEPETRIYRCCRCNHTWREY